MITLWRSLSPNYKNVMWLFMDLKLEHPSEKYEVCLEGIQPCNMKNRDICWGRYKIQETLCIGQWPLGPQHLGTSHSSPNHHQMPHRIFLNLINSLRSLPFQRWLYFWEKLEVTGHQIWVVVGLSHLGDLLFHWKRQEMWYISGHVVVMKLPITSCP